MCQSGNPTHEFLLSPTWSSRVTSCAKPLLRNGSTLYSLNTGQQLNDYPVQAAQQYVRLGADEFLLQQFFF